MDWTLALRELPPELCIVSHQPETPRYARARQKLRHLVQASVLLGYRTDPERPRGHLLAFWAAGVSRRDAGYYACFRLSLDDDGVPERAVLYCYYDGSDHSPSFRSAGAARLFALSQGFREP